jgi:hypothetical protein
VHSFPSGILLSNWKNDVTIEPAKRRQAKTGPPSWSEEKITWDAAGRASAHPQEVKLRLSQSEPRDCAGSAIQVRKETVIHRKKVQVSNANLSQTKTKTEKKIRRKKKT